VPFFRPSFCEIDLAALRHNYQALKACANGQEVLAVVKANAYGHGAVTVARVLEAEGASIFGVATIEEGLELRKAGISRTILCFGGAFKASAKDLLEYQITPVIFEEETLRRLAQELSGSSAILPFHLKLDTGMGRLGIFPKELSRYLKLIQDSPALKLEGVMTHLACADEEDSHPTQVQYTRFEEVREKLSEMQIPFFHIANSAALIEKRVDHTSLVRPGIALYGAYPNPRFESQIRLEPVLSWKTEIISLKEFPSGAALSYGATYYTSRPSKIAIMALGYADGYSRSFSNCGEVLVRGRRVPVVGRVCMDLTLIDVTDIPEVALGDEVVVIGKQGEEVLFAEELASKIKTISYEIFCGISSRVPRLAVRAQSTSN